MLLAQNRARNNTFRHEKLFVWTTVFFQAAFPLALAFTPVIAAASEKGSFLQQADITPLRTRVYTLAAGETVATVAEKYNMSPAALQRLNQFRTFTRGFENLQPGEELDVPLSPLPAVQWQAQSPSTSVSQSADDLQAQKVAGVATQAGRFFSDNPGRDAAASLARGMATGAAEKEIQQWLGQAGTARVQLNTDRNLSLKNAQLDLLVPLSEQKDSLVFTQSSLHRTDDRSQANLGLGYRWFTRDWMLGGNTFLDYDLSRDHARLGLGLEYGRDFLKLSANSYHRLTNWKDAPELEDYQARPANGWDIRAQGWLPAQPQLGATLTYEQYYGNEVALSGTNNRQRNPNAITGGVNYTPFPLLTFSAEHMQGKSGINDTRFGVGMNYQLGVPWHHQINPDAVAGLRTLAGGRYDLVERNNNIVLDYRKKSVIHLRTAEQVTGFAGEQKSLGVSVTSRHGLERIDWSAAPLVAAGGKIVEKGSDWTVELPAWNTAPDGINSYTITAVAVDKRGNVSNQSTTRVTLQAPEVSTINSEFTPAASTLPADGTSVQVLTLSIRDGQGKTMDVSPGEVEVAASGVKSAAVSPPSRKGSGVFEVTVTAGKDAETVILVPTVQGVPLAQATVVINDILPVHSQSTIGVDKTSYVAGEDMVVTVTLKDAQDNPVSGQAAALTADAVTVPNAAIQSGSSWSDNGDGTYTGRYTAQAAGTGLKAALQLGGWSSGVASEAYAITAADAVQTHAAIATDAASYVAGEDMVVTVTLKDAQDNPVSGQAAALTADAVTVPNAAIQSGSSWSDNGDGTYTGRYTAQAAGTGLKAALQLGGWSSGVASEAYAITADNSTAIIANLKVDTDLAPANGTATNEVQAFVADANDNPLAGESVTFIADNGATIITASVITDTDGIASTSLSSTTAGVSNVTASVNDSSQSVAATFLATEFTGVAVNNYNFSVSSGFPSTGFTGAEFNLEVAGLANYYNWNSSSSWAPVNDNGKVTFTRQGDSSPVTITAIPKAGGSTLTYTFRVNKWFNNFSNQDLLWDDAKNWCANEGQSLPTDADLSLGQNVRGMGSMWSEWGTVANYSSSGFNPERPYWTSGQAIAGGVIYGRYVYMTNGRNAFGGPNEINVMCRQDL